jgi:hypothetical protein
LSGSLGPSSWGANLVAGPVGPIRTAARTRGLCGPDNHDHGGLIGRPNTRSRTTDRYVGGPYPSGCATRLVTVRRVAVGIAGLILLCGCAAEVGQTNLTLHQRAVFPDGTRYELGSFVMSEVDNDRAEGPPRIPGNEVTVSVLVENAGAAIGASDVAMSLAYHGDRGQELVPPVVASGATVIASGAKGTISKTFRVEDPTELFQARYLRVRIELPGHPAVTFSGSNP